MSDSTHGTEVAMRAPVLGMILFVASEVMFFGALFGAYYSMRAASEQWPPTGTPAIDVVLPVLLTIVLLSSSATQHRAGHASRRGDLPETLRWTTATLLLGSIFLAGEAFEWARFFDEDFTASTNVFGTLFFTMTGFHGLHLSAGLVMLVLAMGKARRTSLLPEGRAAVEAATYYWHFVDGVWVVLVFSLYALTA